MMKIGQVADRAGVSVDTVRFYERRGVLAEPERLPSGYRVYDGEAVERIRLTKSLQALGMTLAEIIDALSVADQGEVECVDERWRLEVVLKRLDDEMSRMQRLRKEVENALTACADGDCLIEIHMDPTR